MHGFSVIFCLEVLFLLQLMYLESISKEYYIRSNIVIDSHPTVHLHYIKENQYNWLKILYISETTLLIESF